MRKLTGGTLRSLRVSSHLGCIVGRIVASLVLASVIISLAVLPEVVSVDSVLAAGQVDLEVFVDSEDPGDCTIPVNEYVKSTVTFAYVVTNRGNATLTDVKVTDSIQKEIGIIPALVVGESKTLFKTVTVTKVGSYTSTGTVTTKQGATDTDKICYDGVAATDLTVTLDPQNKILQYLFEEGKDGKNSEVATVTLNVKNNTKDKFTINGLGVVLKNWDDKEVPIPGLDHGWKKGIVLPTEKKTYTMSAGGSKSWPYTFQVIGKFAKDETEGLYKARFTVSYVKNGTRGSTFADMTLDLKNTRAVGELPKPQRPKAVDPCDVCAITKDRTNHEKWYNYRIVKDYMERVQELRYALKAAPGTGKFWNQPNNDPNNNQCLPWQCPQFTQYSLELLQDWLLSKGYKAWHAWTKNWKGTGQEHHWILVEIQLDNYGPVYVPVEASPPRNKPNITQSRAGWIAFVDDPPCGNPQADHPETCTDSGANCRYPGAWRFDHDYYNWDPNCLQVPEKGIAVDINGLEKDVFIVGEDVYYHAEGLPWAGSKQTYDLYVVPDNTAWPDCVNSLNRVAGTVASVDTNDKGDNVTRARGDNVTKARIWQNPQRLGDYDIVLDENKNNRYTAYYDVLDDNVPVGFKVIAANQKSVVEQIVQTPKGEPKKPQIIVRVYSGTLVSATESIAKDPPKDYVYPDGFFSVKITNLQLGQSVVVVMTFQREYPPNAKFWKYFKGAWHQVDILKRWTNEADGVKTYSMAIELKDGGVGDNNPIPDGMIEDPGGPGIPFLPSPAFPSMYFGIAAAVGAFIVGSLISRRLLAKRAERA